MPKDNLLWYARIGVFQSAKFKSFNKDYIDPSVKLGNQELSAVYLLICALSLMYASVIFNRIVKFPVFLKCCKNVIYIIPY